MLIILSVADELGELEETGREAQEGEEPWALGRTLMRNGMGLREDRLFFSGGSASQTRGALFSWRYLSLYVN